jgi:hypothetical protein
MNSSFYYGNTYFVPIRTKLLVLNHKLLSAFLLQLINVSFISIKCYCFGYPCCRRWPGWRHKQLNSALKRTKFLPDWSEDEMYNCTVISDHEELSGP